MKVWELEEGKEYKLGNKIYTINEGELLYKDNEDIGFIYCCIKYNDITKYNFTEYTPPIDWSKVEVDTKLLVKGDRSDRWIRRYFAKYENNRIYAFDNGYTSWVTGDSDTISCWNYAKLYTEES